MGPGVRGDVMKMMQEDDWKMIGIFQGVGGTFFVSEFDLSSEWGNIWQPHVQCGDPSVGHLCGARVAAAGRGEGQVLVAGGRQSPSP